MTKTQTSAVALGLLMAMSLGATSAFAYNGDGNGFGGGKGEGKGFRGGGHGNGLVSSEMRDEWRAEHRAEMANMTEEERIAHRDEMRANKGERRTERHQEMADFTGLSIDELKEVRQSGETIADVLTEQGITEAEAEVFLTERANDHVDEIVERHDLDASEEQTLRARIAEYVQNILEKWFGA